MSKNCCRILICILLLGSCAAMAGDSNSSQPDSEMISVLGAPRPHPSYGNQADIFGRFVGTWDCDYSFIANNGNVTHKKGELLFGWILDGRALQDIWISYPIHPKEERKAGTSIRFYDPKTKLWQVVFVAPAYGGIVTVSGGLEGDRIVLRGKDTDGSLIRWSFNDIKQDSFVWRGETSYDQGKSWVLQEEHHMTRRKQMARK